MRVYSLVLAPRVLLSVACVSEALGCESITRVFQEIERALTDYGAGRLTS